MTKGLFTALDIYRDVSSRTAAMNMAIDEALLEAAKVPSIRFYGWNSPALSFGYFGRFADVEDYAIPRDLARRWTGGGIVFHGDDLTYSIVIPASDPAFAESSISIYESVHCALREALMESGQRAKLATIPALCERQESRTGDFQIAPAVENRRSLGAAVSDRGYNCFANAVRADVLVDGRKVAGAAQRRTRTGLLQQGSIQNVDFGNGLADRFARRLSEKRCERLLDETLVARAQQIAEQKYGTDSWLRRC